MIDKKPSGAEFRRRRAAEAEVARREEDARRAEGRSAPAPGDAAPPLTYAELPPPPIGDTASLITWGAQVLAVTMHRIMLDPAAPERDKWRLLMDGCAKLGMIRDKAKEQEDIKRALGKAKAKKEDERPDVSGPAPPPIPRPPR